MSSSSHLTRSLGLKLAIVIVIGNIIGSGVYIKVAPMAAELHAPRCVCAGAGRNNNFIWCITMLTGHAS